MALLLVGVMSACGNHNQDTRNLTNYSGPPVTQIVVKKKERELYLVSGKDVVKQYRIQLGNSPQGAKQYEGDGKTPEGLYFVNRFNPNSRYHLSVGISYPNDQDMIRAQIAGLRPGGDIMIHGLGPEGRILTKKTSDWTAGCIAVSDKDIEEIYSMLQPGTPIFIYP